ncbi:hypothetical protein IL099_001523 [Enterococcus hirae]|nr:hypothetical protein [Enterococcus hirae]
MEKLNKKNGEKVSVQSKNQRGIFYRLKDRLKLNKKNGKKVIVQPEDQSSLAYELTNKYKLEKNKSDDMKALVALGKDLSKYAPATIEGILFYLPLTPEKKNLFQPRNRIVQPEDQQSHAYRLTNKYELKMERTNPEKFAKLGRELSRYDPATIEGILLHLPLIPEEKDLLQPRNRIVQPEDQLELADRLIDKYKLKNKHTNLKTMAALGKDLSRYDPDSTEGILLHLPLIPEEKKQLKPRNRIVQPEDQLELAYRITKKYKLKHQHTNLKTFVALGKDLSRYDPDSTEGILLHLPLIPEEKNLLQPRNRIVKPEDRLEIADRLTDKYNLKMERTDPVTFAKLDRELSKYDSDSTEGILLHLPLIPEEKKLLQPRNRIVNPENQPKMNLSSTLSQGLNNLDSKPKNPLQTSPKPNLRTLLNQSENTPGLEPNTSPKPGTLPKAPARINLLNVVVQNKIVSLLAETIKVNYQLSENKTISPKDLHEIAITIENSYLDEKYMDTLSDNLVMRIEEKEALRDIIRERAKQQTDKKQENEADIKINGKTIAEVVDDNALLLSRAMNTALALNENQKVEPKMLSTMAEFIGSRKLNEINRRNIPYMLTLTKEDKKELNEIINGKTTLLSKLPELDRTNPNPIDQVPLPLNQRLSNLGSEQNTPPKPNKNIKQMNSLSQGSAEVSR